MRRPTFIIGSAIVAIMIVDLMVLAGVRGLGRGPRSREVSDRLVARSGTLQKLQAATNEDRDALAAAFARLDQILNAARAPGGASLATAHALWSGTADLFEAARKAQTDLPTSTARVISESKAGREDIATLTKLVTSPGDRVYLESLDEALRLLIVTHQSYARMNDKITSGFDLYEQLFAITAKFIMEDDAQSFGSPALAATVYTSRVGDLPTKIGDYRSSIQTLQAEADASARAALVAFQRAAAKRPGA